MFNKGSTLYKFMEDVMMKRFFIAVIFMIAFTGCLCADNLNAITMGKPVIYSLSKENIIDQGQGMNQTELYDMDCSVNYVSKNDTGDAIITLSLNSLYLSCPDKDGTFEFDSENEEDLEKLDKKILFGYNILLSTDVTFVHNSEYGVTDLVNWDKLFKFAREKFRLFPSKKSLYKAALLRIIQEVFEFPFVVKENIDLKSPFKILNKSEFGEGQILNFETFFEPEKIGKKKATYKISGGVVGNAVFTQEEGEDSLELDMSDFTVKGNIEFDQKKGKMIKYNYEQNESQKVKIKKDGKEQEYNVKISGKVKVTVK